MTTAAEHLGSRIRDARVALELSQPDFAALIGVHEITVSKWERGVSSPSVAMLVRIASRSGRSLAFFTGGSDA